MMCSHATIFTCPSMRPPGVAHTKEPGSLRALSLFLTGRFGRRNRRLRWEACFPPPIPAAEEGGRVLHSVSIQIQHRTGARMLGRSGTVGNDELSGRTLLQPGHELGTRNAQSSLDVADVVLLFRPNVDVNGLPFFDHFNRFVPADPARRFH